MRDWGTGTWLRRLAIGGGALVLLAVVSLVGFRAWAASQAEERRERWRSEGRGQADFYRRHPTRTANESAIELERLAAAAGLDLAPRSSARATPRVRHPHGRDRAGRPRAEGAMRKADDWLRDVLDAEPGAGPLPPEELRAYFTPPSPEWRAVRDHLLREETPRWASRVLSGADAPLPNLLGHVKVQKLLLAEALVASEEGRVAEAEQALEAAWRFNESLSGEPAVIALLIRTHVLRLQAGVARRLPALPARPWIERFDGVEHGPALTDALVGDAWVIDQSMRDGPTRGTPGGSLRADAQLALLAPAIVAATFEVRGAQIEAVEQADECPADLAGVHEAIGAIPSWNRSGRFLASNLTQVLGRAWAGSVEAELTARVLAVRANGGQAPDGWSRSRCAAARYEIERHADGGFIVRYVGPEFELANPNAPVVLRHDEPAGFAR